MAKIKSIDTNPEMTQIVELTQKYFIVAIINMSKVWREKMVIMNEQMNQKGISSQK